MEPDEEFKVTDRRRRVDDAEESGPEGLSPPPSPPKAPVGRAPRERSLAGLFVMLARSAVAAMGAADLDQAADAIDLLLLLREKTEGHRTDEETRALEDLLYDVQLRYVSAKKAGG
ncbi:MAG: DUF1844 domain-containing protein [Candidatus Rokuibacteriota bacterium]